MGKESFDVVRFDLGPLLQGQIMKRYLEGSLCHLLLLVEVWHVQITWLGNQVIRIL